MMAKPVLRRRCALLALAAGLAAGPLAGALAEPRTVAVTAIVEHPALDAARRGLEDQLAASGYTLGRDLELWFESAEGSLSRAAAIAAHFAERRPAVIVPLSTPSAQAVVRATGAVPVVFSAVTDPVAAGLVENLERPGGNVTGVSDLSPVGRHLELIKRVAPDTRALGVISNPAEANSAALLDLLTRHGAAAGIDVVALAATSPGEVETAAGELVLRSVHAIYLPTDNTVAQAIEAVVDIGTRHGVPVFAGDTHAVLRGAIAARGFNYYDLGRQTGRLVARVLRGEAPGDIPVERAEATELYVNPGAAAAMGVTIPDALLEQARRVVE